MHSRRQDLREVRKQCILTVRKMLAKKTSKNQLTLPKEVVKEFPDVVYFDVSVDKRRIVLRPVQIVPADISIENIRKKLEKLGVTENDVTDAVRWSRKRKR